MSDAKSTSDTDGIQAGGPTRKHKRKNTEENLSHLFATFSNTVTENLSTIKSELDQKITMINVNINSVIKTDLEKLKLATNNITSDLSSMRAEYSAIKNEITSLKGSHGALTSEVATLQQSLIYHVSEHEALATQVKEMSVTNNSIKTLKKEHADLKRYVSDLETELNTVQQQNREQNIEITGLPETRTENLNEILIKIATALGVPLRAEDIVFITRIEPRTKIPGRPKAVVAKLTSTMLRDTIISAVRKNRGINTSVIGMSGEPKNIYINEHLTPLNKLLCKQCREAAKNKEYKYSPWVRNGKIYLRKSDSHPIIRIRTESDIKKIF